MTNCPERGGDEVPHGPSLSQRRLRRLQPAGRAGLFGKDGGGKRPKAAGASAAPGGGGGGLDRIVMLIANTQNIREVIAFPKNKKARDAMMNAPSRVEDKQLKDVHIKIDEFVEK